MKEVIGTICCDTCGNEVIFNKDDLTNYLACGSCMSVYDVRKTHGCIILSPIK